MAEKNREFGHRLETFINEAGLSKKKLADTIGVSPSAIGAYINDGRIPEAPILLKIAQSLKKSMEELLSGSISEQTNRWHQVADNLKKRQEAELISDYKKDYKPDAIIRKGDQVMLIEAKFAPIPVVRGPIRAGKGIMVDNIVEQVLAFRVDWIARKGDPAQMAAIKVTGDSMDPTLLAGDLVLVDLSRITIDPQGGIYAVAMDNEIMIKRLELIPPLQKIRVISDNRSKYEPYDIDPDKLIINGKVIWFGRELER